MYIFILLYFGYNLQNIFTYISIFTIKNYYTLFSFNKALINIDDINPNRRIIPIEKFKNEFNLYVLYISFTEAIIYYYLIKYINFNNFNILKELFYLTFTRFFFDIIFDIFHYSIHYLLHKNKFLYNNIHRIHHNHVHPSIIIKFYNHPLDNLLTECIPLYTGFYLISKIMPYFSVFTIIFILFIKNVQDVLGHSGKLFENKYNNVIYNFVTFNFISYYFNIYPYIIDHDIHHTNSKFNFSSRTTILDKIFNTYKSSI